MIILSEPFPCRISHLCLKRRKYCDNSHLYQDYSDNNHHHTCHAHLGHYGGQDHHQPLDHHHPNGVVPHQHLHGVDHHKAPVFTVENYRSTVYMDDHDPLYEDIRYIPDKSNDTGDEFEEKIDKNDSDEKERTKNIIKSSLLYGTIVTKDVARYKPSTPIILRK